MRKLVAVTQMTLDGVMQALGGSWTLNDERHPLCRAPGYRPGMRAGGRQLFPFS